jgi:hypothetical protein
MTATARSRRARATQAAEHIHLPSVHSRDRKNTGFDYEEDFYIYGRFRVERVVKLVMVERGIPVVTHKTTDELSAEDREQLWYDLPILMDEGNPAAEAIMKECARKELARQLRIAAGQEQACLGCGCSETRACSGNCFWATETLCSRCV